MREHYVDNRPLREAVQARVAAGEYSYRELSKRLGWTLSPGSSHGDTTRLKRRLGLKATTARDGSLTCWTTTVRYDIAVAIARAADIDYTDVGI